MALRWTAAMKAVVNPTKLCFLSFSSGREAHCVYGGAAPFSKFGEADIYCDPEEGVSLSLFGFFT